MIHHVEDAVAIGTLAHDGFARKPDDLVADVADDSSFIAPGSVDAAVKVDGQLTDSGPALPTGPAVLVIRDELRTGDHLAGAVVENLDHAPAVGLELPIEADLEILGLHVQLLRVGVRKHLVAEVLEQRLDGDGHVLGVSCHPFRHLGALIKEPGIHHDVDVHGDRVVQELQNLLEMIRLAELRMVTEANMIEIRLGLLPPAHGLAAVGDHPVHDLPLVQELQDIDKVLIMADLAAGELHIEPAAFLDLIMIDGPLAELNDRFVVDPGNASVM